MTPITELSSVIQATPPFTTVRLPYAAGARGPPAASAAWWVGVEVGEGGPWPHHHHLATPTPDSHLAMALRSEEAPELLSSRETAPGRGGGGSTRHREVTGVWERGARASEEGTLGTNNPGCPFRAGHSRALREKLFYEGGTEDQRG